MIIDSLLKSNPFSLNAKTKCKIFSEQIKFLTIHHYKNCKIYKKIGIKFGYISEYWNILVNFQNKHVINNIFSLYPNSPL